jgi:hypothetical protein
MKSLVRAVLAGELLARPVLAALLVAIWVLLAEAVRRIEIRLT